MSTRPYIYPAFDVNHSYEDTDVFVSLSKLKTHGDCGITLSLKNSFGITPATLYGSREIDFSSERYEGYRMPRLIVDITGARPIDLAIIDGIESTVGGEGPWIPGCRPARPGVLILGRNPVCTDAVAMAVIDTILTSERMRRPSAFTTKEEEHHHRAALTRIPTISCRWPKPWALAAWI